MFSGNILDTEASNMLLPLYQYFFSFTSLLTSVMEKNLFQSVICGKCHLSGVSDSQNDPLYPKNKTLIRNSRCVEGNFKFTILLQFSLNTNQNDYIRLFNKMWNFR